MSEYQNITSCIQRLRAGGNISRVNADEAADLLEHYLVSLENPEIESLRTRIAELTSGEPVAWKYEQRVWGTVAVANTYSEAPPEQNPKLAKNCINISPLFLAAPSVEGYVKEECKWRDYDNENMSGTYEGSCGIVWSFIDGGIAENDCKFCPRCGGNIIDEAIEASKP